MKRICLSHKQAHDWLAAMLEESNYQPTADTKALVAIIIHADVRDEWPVYVTFADAPVARPEHAQESPTG
jgi:hypothetical protein